MVFARYGFTSIILTVNWTVLFHDEFDREYRTLAKSLQDELLAHALIRVRVPSGRRGPRTTASSKSPSKPM
jgi:hypothetical protein